MRAQSELGRTEVIGVEQWAEIRRLHFVRGLSIREISRRTGLHRDTIRRAISSGEPPAYSRAAKLDPFKPEIQRLLRADPALPGVRIGELLEPLGWVGGKTILDDYLREIRPLFVQARTTQRTVYRPGEVCQFDVWEPRAEIPVGHGQTRQGAVERLQGYAETNFETGRVFANERDFQAQLDAWFARVNARTHKTLRARPAERLAEELEVMAPLPAQQLDTGEVAGRHARSFARHRTITALEHARALKRRRGNEDREPVVETRSLDVYDRLIA